MNQQVFHFKHQWLKDQLYIFNEAMDYVIAKEVKDVIPALKKIEEYNNQGYYAVGYISYEAARAFHTRMKTYDEVELPLVYFGIYKDYTKSYELNHRSIPELNWYCDTTRSVYNEAISSIHKSIRQGISYQVNYTIRLIAEFDQFNTRALYEQLRQSQQANYTCHLQFSDFEIMSVSPELFFAWDGRQIETRPMKGTIKRGRSYKEDIIQKQQLKESEKDQAENVMIVDLLRNDLSRIAKPGTVQVPKLFDIEAYPTVYQMTSTVTAETRGNITLTSIFEALFPCGSITGAPKISTMNLIHELESSPREVYCGAIGMVTPEQTAVFNVPIRTIWVNHHANKAVYGVGGGITWDSSSEGEYDEAIAKSEVLKGKLPSFELLETMKLENGQVVLLEEHLERLKESASYFQMELSIDEVIHQLDDIKRHYKDGNFKLRLLLNKDGDIKLEVHPLSEVPSTLSVALSRKPINRTNKFYYHKTTYRSIYHVHQVEGFYDTLLWNEDGYITEFINGNVIFEINGVSYTPPVHDGLLPGTYRKKLLTENKIKEKSLLKSDLPHIDRLWFINSVKGKIEINHIDYGPEL